MLARVLVGAGDAMVFVSVIRVVALWFGQRQSPLITQAHRPEVEGGGRHRGLVPPGRRAPRQVDPTSSARPSWGRPATVVLLVMRDALAKSTHACGSGASPDFADHLGQRHPARALVALTSQFGMTVFTLLWGFPFLVQGQGLSETTARVLLVLMTATQILVGPVLRAFVARHPYQRSHLVL